MEWEHVWLLGAGAARESGARTMAQQRPLLSVLAGKQARSDYRGAQDHVVARLQHWLERRAEAGVTKTRPTFFAGCRAFER